MRKLGTFLLCTVTLAACQGPDDAGFSDLELTQIEESNREEEAGPEHGASQELAPPEGQEESVHGVDPNTVIDCTGANRLIGVLNAGAGDSCDPGFSGAIGLPPGWTAYPLFADGSPGVDGLTEPVPGELDRYCAYDFSGPPILTIYDYYDTLDAIDQWADMNLNSLAADCRGQFAQADLYDATVTDALESAFMKNIGWDMGATTVGTGTGRTAIEIAVVDTVSEDAATLPLVHATNEHGLFMATLIDAITCPVGATNCGNDTRHVLAMPREDWDSGPDWSTGGHHGTQGDLAMGIYEAVMSWRQRRLANPGTSSPRLVLNLSVGWNRDVAIATDANRGPAKSLISALEYASCQGAIVTSAAGNNPDESCPGLPTHKGPLAPAQFEEFDAPTAAECASKGYDYGAVWALTYPVHDPLGTPPLVWAVGGVDEYDEPLANSRLDGMPRQAALGSNALVDSSNSSWTEPLTGTSVSAAVVAGTAALLWSYRPELSPYEVMNTIYSSGWDIGDTQDFPAATILDPVRRLSVCSAISDACVGQVDCPTSVCTVAAQPSDGNLGEFAVAVQSIVAALGVTMDSYAEVPEPALVCEPSMWSNLADPQPEQPICSRCNLFVYPNVDEELQMTIDPVYVNDDIQRAELTLYDDIGTPTTIMLNVNTISSLNLQPNSQITQSTFDASSTTSAILEFELASGETQANTVTVLQM